MMTSSRLKVCYFAFVLCLTSSAEALGQIGPLPLKEGNYWIYDEVLGDQIRPGIGRIEVHGPIRVRSVATDTNYWFDSQQAYGDSGELYHRVSITGMRILPGLQPDTLFIRADPDGNLWCGGYIQVQWNTARVSAVDDPWLLADGPWNWTLRLSESGNHVTFYRSQWTGADSTIDGGERWVSSDEPYDGWSTGSGALVDFARRYLPDLQPSSPGRLLSIATASTGSSHSSLDPPGFVLLTGLGIVYVSIPTQFTERQGIHLELSEAKVNGQVMRYYPQTSVRNWGWGQVKASLTTGSETDDR